MTLHRRGTACSWCHALNWEDGPHWPICWGCSHRADVARVDCDCKACVRGSLVALARLGLPRKEEPA